MIDYAALILMAATFFAGFLIGRMEAARHWHSELVDARADQARWKSRFTELQSHVRAAEKVEGGAP